MTHEGRLIAGTGVWTGGAFEASRRLSHCGRKSPEIQRGQKLPQRKAPAARPGRGWDPRVTGVTVTQIERYWTPAISTTARFPKSNGCDISSTEPPGPERAKRNFNWPRGISPIELRAFSEQNRSYRRLFPLPFKSHTEGCKLGFSFLPHG
jgi:hypothetical protein